MRRGWGVRPPGKVRVPKLNIAPDGNVTDVASPVHRNHNCGEKSPCGAYENDPDRTRFGPYQHPSRPAHSRESS